MLRTINSTGDALEFLRWASERKVVACDTETSGIDVRAPGFTVRLIQFGDARSSWVIPFRQWWGVVNEFFSRFDGTILMHNARYDIAALRAGGIVVPWHQVIDTMIAVRLAESDRPAGLKDAASRHVAGSAALAQQDLAEAMAKNHWGWDTVPLDYPPYIYYAAMDTILTYRLWEHPVVRKGLASPVFQMESEVLPICSGMSDNGMRIDLDYCREQSTELRKLSSEIRTQMTNVYGLSIGSNQSLGSWLLGQGARITHRTNSGGPSVAKDQLQELIVDPTSNDHVRYVAEQALRYRKAEKIAGTYLEPFIYKADSNDRLHADIETLAAKTSRMSIRNPALQTLPKPNDDPYSRIVRKSVIPWSDDHVLISADFEQIELRIAASLSNDQRLIEAFAVADTDPDGDLFAEMGKIIYRDPNFKKSDPRRKPTKNTCVPLTTEILTRRGWMKHDEVLVGDETVGYNFETGRSEWTRVLDVIHPGPQPLVEVANKYIKFTSTADHRWIVRRRRPGRVLWRTTSDLSTEDAVLSAVPLSDTSPGYFISDDEAEVLGWLITDGTLKVSPLNGSSSQGRTGQNQQVLAQIYQKKEPTVERIRAVLADSGLLVTATYGGGDRMSTWRLSSPSARDLLDRVGLLTEDGSRPDPVSFSSGFSESQRERVLQAMQLADGWVSGHQTHFVKGDPWVVDVFRVLHHLSGTSTRTFVRGPEQSAWQKKDCYLVAVLAKNVVGMQRSVKTDREPEDVWCVRTRLGSWTMRESPEAQYFITGNCYGMLYGAGPEKIAATAGISYEQASEARTGILAAFPGLSLAMKRYEREVKEFGSITTLMGREIQVDQDKAYRGLNALIQATASDLFKRAVVYAAHAGLDTALLLPVHDELVACVPRVDADEAMVELEKAMVVEDLQVRIPAQPQKMERWAG